MNTCAFRVAVRRLQMSLFTNADGLGLVPAGLAVSPHDASQGRVSLQRVAAVAAVSDGGTQLELDAHPRPVAYRTGLKAGLPGVLCGRRQHSGKIRDSERSVTRAVKGCFAPNSGQAVLGLGAHGFFGCYSPL